MELTQGRRGSGWTPLEYTNIHIAQLQSRPDDHLGHQTHRLLPEQVHLHCLSHRYPDYLVTRTTTSSLTCQHGRFQLTTAAHSPGVPVVFLISTILSYIRACPRRQHRPRAAIFRKKLKSRRYCVLLLDCLSTSRTQCHSATLHGG